MSRTTGWHFNPVEHRLEMRYTDILIAYLNASGLYLADDTPVGGVADPLELGAAVFTDYVAVGADPAATGAIRLAIDEYIKSNRITDVADVGLIGWDGTLAYVSVDPDGRGAIFGDEIHIANDVWIIGRNSDDDDDVRIIQVSSDDTINIGDALTVDPNSGISTGIFISSGNLLPFNGSSLNLGAADTTWANVFAEDLYGISMPTTVDPETTGQLFTCTAAELAGLLAAGAKHVLLSKGAP